jgi:hypothetical protein
MRAGRSAGWAGRVMPPIPRFASTTRGPFGLRFSTGEAYLVVSGRGPRGVRTERSTVLPDSPAFLLSDDDVAQQMGRRLDCTKPAGSTQRTSARQLTARLRVQPSMRINPSTDLMLARSRRRSRRRVRPLRFTTSPEVVTWSARRLGVQRASRLSTRQLTERASGATD